VLPLAKVAVPVLVKVVNFPVDGEVAPIAGGLARYVLNPVPETVELALNVVKAPVEAVVAPTVVLSTEPPVIATAFAFCSANVPTPVSVWSAFHAVVPVELKELSAGVECFTVTVMPRI
jgi:hypothetical protein